MQRALVIVGLIVGCGGDSGTTLGAGDVVQSLEGVALAVDADAIYLLRGSGEVWRAPLDGSEPVMLGASGQLQSKDVVVDATHAYWLTLNLQEIHRVSKLGGSPERIVTGAALRGWLGVHGPTLYFTVEGQTPGINATPATGGGVPTLVGPDARDTFVVTDQAVFYAGRLGEVFRADLPAGPVTTLAPANGEIISALAVADTDVFYTSIESDLQTFTRTRLRRVPITGGTPKVLWEADKNALHTGMAIDATHVYWLHFKDLGEGSHVRYELHRLRRDDDEHELYGGPWTSVRELAADETNIYVLAEGGTYRIAKMP